MRADKKLDSVGSKVCTNISYIFFFSRYKTSRPFEVRVKPTKKNRFKKQAEFSLHNTSLK